MRADELLDLLESPPADTFRLGTIPATYTTGRPTITFDGEDTESTKAYPHLASYSPAANDRVLLARVGASWVVIGTVT